MVDGGADRERAVVRGALLIAAALGLLVLVRAFPTPVEAAKCLGPRELAAEAGRTVAVACAPRVALPSLRGPAVLLFGQRLDLNTADASTLTALPNIGPRRAAAIVAARQQRPFGSAAELQRVRGIGPRTVAGLAGWVRVGGPEPAAERVRSEIGSLR